MKKIVFPGTFDPPTLGHLSIIQKASQIFDKVYVAIGYNSRKNQTAFSVAERMQFLKMITRNLPQVEISIFEGLIIDYALKIGACAILRAIRNITDFDYENLQAQMNRQMGHIETLFMVADEPFRYISSSLVREIASHGKRLEEFVPQEIEPFIYERLYTSLRH